MLLRINKVQNTCYTALEFRRPDFQANMTPLRAVLSLLLISFTPERSIVSDLLVNHQKIFGRSLLSKS